MRALILATSLLIPLTALAEEAGLEGRRVAETVFATIDASARGAVHMGEIEAFCTSVHAGMDYDDNGAVSFAEFLQWDPGFRAVAAGLGRDEGFVTALRIMFALWDRDGDDSLTEAEMRSAMSTDFRRADLDDDGFLSQDEFIGNFAIMVAMRAAIRPDL